MPTPEATHWYHSNRYSASSACEHCKGVVRHEPWCFARNPRTFYAYQAVLDAVKLTEQDRLILHALGVAWVGKTCIQNCTEQQISGGILPQ
ncbi:MAG TPA: hypothetical protein VF135_12200 [Terriglobales bacterium]